MTFAEAAYQVLKQAKKALTPDEIVIPTPVILSLGELT